MRTPHGTWTAMKQGIEAGLRRSFPLTTGDRTLELQGVTFGDTPAHDDYNGQKEAGLANRTWGATLRGRFALKDAAVKVLDTQQVALGTVPVPTNRHTFIVDGREYQVSHQRRLRPGMYSKLDRNGHAVMDFNLEKGRNFGVVLDPANSRFHMKIGNSHIPLDAVLHGVFNTGLGLGKDFERTPTPEEQDHAVKTLWAATQRVPLPAMPEAKEGLRAYFNAATMHPDINRMTVGHGHETVNPIALQDAAKHVLAIHKGQELPSGKEQLAYQEIFGVEDHLEERFVKNRGRIAMKVKQKLGRAGAVGDINLQGAVAPMVHGFFTTNSLANTTAQINPLEMAENAFKITSMGDGGIGDAMAIPNEVRVVHPSTSGFIDPVRTPDNSKAGVDVRAAMNVQKIGRALYAPLVDVKTGARVLKSPQELYHEVVAHDKEPVENGRVRAIHQGQIVEVTPDKVTYHLPADEQFTVSTAIVPFVPASHAHRVAMGAKMLGQALSLTEREVPLVDTLHSGAADGLAPRASVSGVVHRLQPGVLTLKDGSGKLHAVHYPHDFPLNGGSYLDTTLHVKAGDHVVQNQVLGDTNFTQNGQLALGKNLNVAFIPFKGVNYEDGIAVTETGARKLSSNHQFLHDVELDPRSVFDKRKFESFFPGKFETAHLQALDAKGVVKEGTVLTEGSPIYVAMRKRVANPEAILLGKAHKSLIEPFRDTSLTWDKPYDGMVTAVKHTSRGVKVTIKATAPAVVGDKLAGRYGNKGVITAIVPDHEAPHTADGRIPDVLLNSAGLNSRMNPGQIFEVSAGKALQKLGVGPQKFPHFMEGNTHALVTKLVEQSGAEPTEEMFDGPTGRSIGRNMMGPMYMLKLFKTADSGYSARSGGSYDLDLRPAKGGEDGAKSIGTLDFAALMAGGGRAILREAATHKAEYSPDAFAALWRGQDLPPPKATFAYEKFQAMLRGMGVNVKQEGSKLHLLPLTDHDTLARSGGEIRKATSVNDKEDPVTGLPFRPEEGGLFDPVITGGLVGSRWGHFTLSEPVVNPLFQGPARTLLGLTQEKFDQLVTAEGGAGVARQLAAIQPAARIAQLSTELKGTNAIARRDVIYKQLRYLKALDRHGLAPDQAYVMKQIPVIPPKYRPIYPDPDTGKIVTSDANRLYQNLMLVSQQLAEHQADGDPEMVGKLRHGLMQGVSAMQGLDSGLTEAGDKPAQGFLSIIGGNGSAKSGFFQSKLVSRRQDVAGRGVAVPDPGLGLDQIGLPEPMAWKLFRSHVVGELVKSGMPLPKAAEHVKDMSPTARRALDVVMGTHPVLMSRAPSLHKFNVQAFMPMIVPGKSIRTNNLIHKGFNLDHDGDAVNIHVPLGLEAIQEAKRLVPSLNLFNPLNRAPINTPTNETTMGLWKITNPQGPAVKQFKTKAEALAAYRRGDVGIADTIEVGA